MAEIRKKRRGREQNHKKDDLFVHKSLSQIEEGANAKKGGVKTPNSVRQRRKKPLKRTVYI